LYEDNGLGSWKGMNETIAFYFGAKQWRTGEIDALGTMIFGLIMEWKNCQSPIVPDVRVNA